MSGPQYGPHRWSAGHHATGHNGQLRRACFDVMDMREARFVDCDLSGVRIVDSWLVDVAVDGYLQDFVVNGVDVSGYVNAELDRRHPERVQLRAIGSADDFRAMWDTLVGLWSRLTDRAVALGEATAHQRVHDEWSFV